MNAHDSEKVIGTLEQQGYARVQDEADAGLILYNTCSIRDKAEQKVFHRLNEYKRLQGEGKKFAVLGCVAQQEGEKIFDSAPYVSLVSGSASYRNLPEMLAAPRSRRRRASPASTTARPNSPSRPSSPPARNPHRGYITIIEGCDKFCAYCVVPYTRGKERSPHLGLRPRRSPQDGRRRLHRDSVPRPERQLLPRPLRPDVLRRTARRRRRTPRHPPRALHHLAPPRLHPRHRPGHRRHPDSLRPRPSPRAVRFDRRPQGHVPRVHSRLVPRTHELDQGRSARHQHHQRHDRRLPRRDRRRLRRHHHAGRRSQVRRRLRLQVLAQAEHSGSHHGRQHPRRGEVRAPAHPHGPPARDPARTLRPPPRRGAGSHGRELQSRPRNQVVGRSSQNKTVNFTTAQLPTEIRPSAAIFRSASPRRFPTAS